MFRPVPMAHVLVQIHERDVPAVTRLIARQGLLHLVDVAHGSVSGAPAGGADLLETFRALRARVTAAAEQLNVDLEDIGSRSPEPPYDSFEQERTALDALLTPIEAGAAPLHRAREAARERRHAAVDAARDARRLEDAEVDCTALESLRYASVVVGTGPEADLQTLARLLAAAPFAIVALETRREPLVAVAVPQSLRGRLDEALRLVNVSRTCLIAGANARALEDDAGAAAAAEREAAQALEAFGAGNTSAIQGIWRRVETAILLLRAQGLFGAIGRFAVISGWIPEQSAAALREAILQATGGRAAVDVERPDDLPAAEASALQIPILYRNPLLLRPFQNLVQLYGTPEYREIEPTAFLAASFLLMFGLMFGDVGHGAILFSAGYCAFRYLPRFFDYAILLMECGVASMIFGALYGSVLGMQGILPVLWIEPIRDLPQFMAMAVGFGAVLVSVGFALNVLNSWRAGERMPALLGMRGMLGAFVYWTAIALAIRALKPAQLVLPSWVVGGLAAGAVLLILLRIPFRGRLRAHGTAGPVTPRWLRALESSIETVDLLFSYAANTLSFIRIAAFAAVHAGVFTALFAVADTLARLDVAQPVSIAVLVVGNVVLILLEGLTVSIQVLRLEYYEFFGKFFRGGGRAYRPLMLRSAGRTQES